MTTSISGQTHGLETEQNRPIALWFYIVGVVGLWTTALYSGGMMLLDPSGTSMGLAVGWLVGTPFKSYFVPGLVLFSVIGLGSAIVLFGIVRRRRWVWWASIGLGIALLGWILTQIALLQRYHFLQLIYGALGVALVLLALHPSTQSYLRPPRDDPTNGMR